MSSEAPLRGSEETAEAAKSASPAEVLPATEAAPETWTTRMYRTARASDALQQFLRFAMVGGVGVGTNASIYAALIFTGLHYVPSSLIAWVVSATTAFMLNRIFTFKSSAAFHKSLIKSLMVYGAQQAVTLLELALLIDVMGLGPVISFVLALPLAVMVSFFGMKYFAFRD